MTQRTPEELAQALWGKGAPFLTTIEEALPCIANGWCGTDSEGTGWHSIECPAVWRPGVAALIADTRAKATEEAAAALDFVGFKSAAFFLRSMPSEPAQGTEAE